MRQNTTIRVAFIPLALKLFDMKLAEQIRKKSINLLKNIKDVEIVGGEKLIFTRSDVENVIGIYQKERIDVLLVQYNGREKLDHFCAIIK